jgi:hypothetical protein
MSPPSARRLGRRSIIARPQNGILSDISSALRLVLLVAGCFILFFLKANDSTLPVFGFLQPAVHPKILTVAFFALPVLSG